MSHGDAELCQTPLAAWRFQNLPRTDRTRVVSDAAGGGHVDARLANRTVDLAAIVGEIGQQVHVGVEGHHQRFIALAQHAFNKAPAGVLSFTVSDGSMSNALDYQQMSPSVPKSPTQLVSFLNNLHPNTNAYVRVWRTDPAFEVQGQDLPDPPPSVGLILAKAQSAQGAMVPRGSKIDELQIETGDVVVTGSKTVQVEVKE